MKDESERERKAERRGRQAAGPGARMENKAGLDGLFYTGHNSKQQTLAPQRREKEKGRRFANVRLLITHPCTCAFACIFPGSLYITISHSVAGPLHVSMLVLLFLTQADLWIDSSLASFVLSQSTKCSVSRGSDTFLLIHPITTQRVFVAL